MKEQKPEPEYMKDRQFKDWLQRYFYINLDLPEHHRNKGRVDALDVPATYRWWLRGKPRLVMK